MRIIAILLILLTGISSTSGQDRAIKKVGVIYELSDYIYQNHMGLTIFDNFVKTYPQEDSINVIIEGLLDQQIQRIYGLEVHKLEFSFEEINNMIKKDDMAAISSYDMIMVVLDEGLTSVNGYVVNIHKGRGINTGVYKVAQIYANLGVELINLSNNKRMIYDLNNHVLDFNAQNIAIRRTKRKYFSPGEDKKELSNDRLIDIQKNLLEMYRLQVKKIFDSYVLFKTIDQLFKEK